MAKGRVQRSFVWKFFDKQNLNESLCKVCGKLVVCRGNTTNLRMHLKVKHSIENADDTPVNLTEEGNGSKVGGDYNEETICEPPKKRFSKIPESGSIFNIDLFDNSIYDDDCPNTDKSSNEIEPSGNIEVENNSLIQSEVVDSITSSNTIGNVPGLASDSTPSVEFVAECSVDGQREQFGHNMLDSKTEPNSWSPNQNVKPEYIFQIGENSVQQVYPKDERKIGETSSVKSNEDLNLSSEVPDSDADFSLSEGDTDSDDDYHINSTFRKKKTPKKQKIRRSLNGQKIEALTNMDVHNKMKAIALKRKLMIQKFKAEMDVIKRKQLYIKVKTKALKQQLRKNHYQ